MKDHRKDFPLPEILRECIHRTLTGMGHRNADKLVEGIGIRIIREITFSSLDDIAVVRLTPYQFIMRMDGVEEPVLFPYPPGLHKFNVHAESAYMLPVRLVQIHLYRDGRPITCGFDLIGQPNPFRRTAAGTIATN